MLAGEDTSDGWKPGRPISMDLGRILIIPAIIIYLLCLMYLKKVYNANQKLLHSGDECVAAVAANFYRFRLLAGYPME
jgi:hypothetical protein